ncbi:hypothetical protein [Paracoccus sp. ME4]|uniref:hypothetical protein n=1 Tax=Paracoccus sp. ME4 TaxID=3138066 RepID=UPI00398AEC8C
MIILKRGWNGVLAALLASTILCGPTMAEEHSAEDAPAITEATTDAASVEDLVTVEMPEVLTPGEDLMASAAGAEAPTPAEGAMPALVLPTEDVAVEQPGDADGPEAMSDPSNYMMNVIRGQLTDRYVSDEAIDADRIQALLTGDYIKDYTHDGDPVSFSNTVFDIEAAKRRSMDEEPVATPDPEPIAAPASVDFLLSPAAIRAMSGMSQDQIEAIALMVEMMNNPGSAPAINPQLALKGIPSLSEEDLTRKSPEELLAHIASAGTSSAVAPEPSEPQLPVSVGDGSVMALANWEMIVSPDGRVEMSNATIPGSRFEVIPGVVVGQFGRVLDISLDQGNQSITFESGDRLEVAQVPLDAGVPALDGEVPADGAVTGGEILVSGPVMRGDEVLVSKADPDRPAARPVTDGDQPAPATSSRPKARPDRSAGKPVGDQGADPDQPETQTSQSSDLTATTKGS